MARFSYILGFIVLIFVLKTPSLICENITENYTAEESTSSPFQSSSQSPTTNQTMTETFQLENYTLVMDKNQTKSDKYGSVVEHISTPLQLKEMPPPSLIEINPTVLSHTLSEINEVTTSPKSNSEIIQSVTDKPSTVITETISNEYSNVPSILSIIPNTPTFVLNGNATDYNQSSKTDSIMADSKHLLNHTTASSTNNSDDGNFSSNTIATESKLPSPPPYSPNITEKLLAGNTSVDGLTRADVKDVTSIETNVPGISKNPNATFIPQEIQINPTNNLLRFPNTEKNNSDIKINSDIQTTFAPSSGDLENHSEQSTQNIVMSMSVVKEEKNNMTKVDAKAEISGSTEGTTVESTSSHETTKSASSTTIVSTNSTPIANGSDARVLSANATEVKVDVLQDYNRNDSIIPPLLEVNRSSTIASVENNMVSLTPIVLQISNVTQLSKPPSSPSTTEQTQYETDKKAGNCNNVHDFFLYLRMHTALCIAIIVVVLLGVSLVCFVLVACALIIKYCALGVAALYKKASKFIRKRRNSSAKSNQQGSLFPRCDVTLQPYASSQNDAELY